MRTLGIAILLGLSCPAFCREVRFTKKVEAGTLKKELTAAGFKGHSVSCYGDDCSITLDPKELRDPMPIVVKHVFVDPHEAREQRRERMRALYSKFDTGTISAEEKDLLLKLLAQHVLGL